MEHNKNTISEIIEMWKLLRQEDKSKKLKFEIFEAAFSKTYALLIEHMTDDCLDKKCIQLISEAYLFANINNTTLDSSRLAASVLTDRMLSSFAFSSKVNDVETTTAYILESREEITLNFKDVSESISKLVKVYDNVFLKNL